MAACRALRSRSSCVPGPGKLLSVLAFMPPPCPPRCTLTSAWCVLPRFSSCTGSTACRPRGAQDGDEHELWAVLPTLSGPRCPRRTVVAHDHPRLVCRDESLQRSCPRPARPLSRPPLPTAAATGSCGRGRSRGWPLPALTRRSRPRTGALRSRDVGSALGVRRSGARGTRPRPVGLVDARSHRHQPVARGAARDPHRLHRR